MADEAEDVVPDPSQFRIELYRAADADFSDPRSRNPPLKLTHMPSGVEVVSDKEANMVANLKRAVEMMEQNHGIEVRMVPRDSN